MGTFCASGLSLPEYFVFPCERVPTAFRNKFPQCINKLQDCNRPGHHFINIVRSKGWSFGKSKKGWMTQDILLIYLKEHFYPLVKG